MKIVPYDLFVKFIITKGHLSLKEVNEVLADYNLNSVTKEVFDRHYKGLRTALPTPIFKQIEDKKPMGSGFLKWMESQGLGEIWKFEKQYKDPNFEATWTLVYDILEDPALRLGINAMLIKGVILDDLANSLNAKFSTMLNRTHLDFYRRHFWNPALMTRKDWKAYIAREDTGDVEIDLLFTALSETVEIVRTKIGLPARIQTSDTLQMMATEALIKFKHFVRLNTTDADLQARFWSDQVQKIIVQHEKFKSADLRDFSKELQMQFEYIQTEFDTPDEATLKEVKEKDPMAKEKEAGSEKDEEPEQTALDV